MIFQKSTKNFRFSGLGSSVLGWVFLCVLSFFSLGCSDPEDTTDKPWMGYAKHISTDKWEWWFANFETYEECKESMNWNVTREFQKENYSKPVGCAFSSNDDEKKIVCVDMDKFQVRRLEQKFRF